MGLLMIDEFTGIDWDNIDIIEPIKDENENIESVAIWSKSGKYLRLTLNQYQSLIYQRKEFCRKLYDRHSTRDE